MNRLRVPSSRTVNRCRPEVASLEDRTLLSGVDITQYHNDLYLSGDNLNETVLTPSNVNPKNFGLLFSQQVDGYVYAEPLYMSGLTINGAVHNVVFIATENDTVYAFDADSNQGADAQPLWVRSFTNAADGITPVPWADTLSSDIVPIIGITGTPVIDPSTNTLYVSTKTKEIVDGDSAHPHYVQTLYALDVTTGTDKFVNGGYQIADTVEKPNFSFSNSTAIKVAGTGVDSTGGVVSFNALRENQRAALQLDGNLVLMMWASHGDHPPYHGWLVAFDKTTLQPVAWFNTSPNGNESGIWQSGEPAAVDPATGVIYFAIGNGTFDEFGSNPNNDYGESVVGLNPNPVGNQFTVNDFFTPYQFQVLNDNDADLGSGGTMLLPDSVGSALHPHLMVETGKSGIIYLIDRDDMGKIPNPGTGPDDVVQSVTAGQAGVWGSPTFLPINANTGIIYYHGTGDVLKGYYITNGHIEDGSLPGDLPILRGKIPSAFPGAQPVISADGTVDPVSPTNAIVWELQVDKAGVSGPGILRAYNPLTLTEYYDSGQTGLRDQLGGAVKFTVPTVADGHVYVGSQYQFSVFGLFPPETAAPATPTNLTAQPKLIHTIQIQLNWSNPTPAAGAAATGIEVLRSTNGVNFVQISTVPASATSFTDLGPLNTGTVYTYELVAVNQFGSSAPSATAKVDLTNAPPVLSITNVTSSAISLSWTAAANNQYAIEQSTDGVNFTTIATIPASQTTYTITGLAPRTYAYQIGASSVNPTSNSISNVQGTSIGAVIDQSAGFLNTSALTANGSTQFAEDVARITYDDDQTGSTFANNRITIGAFTTSFQIRFHEGTQPDYADGITFVIQANSPTALGLGLGGMGYESIGNSIAIKLDSFQNLGDPSDSTTGLFQNGALPAGGVDTTANDGPLINSQAIKLITLVYNGTTLTETITNALDPSQVFTTSYPINIPSVIGGDTAYVGFTGATGDDDDWELQDVTSWIFTSTSPLPGAPTQLHAQRPISSEIDLSWTSNSYNETGFAIYRSQDAVHFTQIGTTTNTTYNDTGLGAGAYQYYVVAYNANGNSPRTTTVVVNGVKTTPTITWNSPASIAYGTALGPAQLDASASVAGTFAYTPAAGTVLHVGNNQALSVVFTPTDTTDYTTASATTKINVLKATPTITWNSPASITYGTALGPAQLDASASVAGTLAYTPAAGTVLSAGNSQALSVLFTPTDTTDYTTASAATTISVLQATPTITWNSPASITYGTALAPAQLDASASVAGTFAYTPAAGTVLHAGNNQTLSVLFTPTDTIDYTTASRTTTISVLQVTPTITWNSPASIAYGTALGPAQLDASASVAGTFAYTPAAGTVLHVGNNQALSVVFTPTDTTDYTTASATTKINVLKATPTITWNSPASITYGTALGPAQLDASASVAGTLAYTPAAGTVLHAGNNQTLSVLFTPTDTIDYTTASRTTTISVLHATPAITWNSPASITYGTALGSDQLDASSLVAGTYAYTPAAGTVLHAGDNQTLSVQFTPTDTIDYTTASRTTTISVLHATPTINWSSPASITYGTALGSDQLDASSLVAGTFAYTPAAGTVLHAGANQTLSVQFTPTDTADYVAVSGSAPIGVTAALLTIKVNDQTMTYGGRRATLTATYTGLVNGDTPAVFDAAGNNPASFSSVLPDIHVGRYSTTASGASDADYTITYVPGTLTITPAVLTITANNATMFSGQIVPVLTASYSGFENGDTPASLASPPALGTSATSASPAGVYAINIGGTTSTDYTITFVNGALTVNPALVTLKNVSIKNQQISGRGTVRVIVIQFSGGLNRSDAADLGNYTLATVPRRKNQKSHQVILSHASYDAMHDTVTLRTRKKLVLTVPLQLKIKSPGVMDAFGRPLTGGLVSTISKRR
jgi:fibronectin type 3 domain-containing protein